MSTGSIGSYSAMYRDPRWQKKRLEIMERDEFRCCSCGATDKTLNVHHAYYEKGKKPWEYDNKMLLTLCEDCHEKWHEVMRRIHYELMGLKSSAMMLLLELVQVSGIEIVIETVYRAYYDKECQLWKDDE